jgi:hypothetical protein
MERPANQDMIDGYLEGRDLDTPAPSENRSYSYKHGFMVGRNEKNGTITQGAAYLRRAADAAMDADDIRALQ